jgi:hypothetical protein
MRRTFATAFNIYSSGRTSFVFKFGLNLNVGSDLKPVKPKELHMAMEKRGNNKYYYRKKRIGGQVVSVYAGKGKAAEKARREDHEARRKKRLANEKFLDFKARTAAFNAERRETEKRMRSLLDATYLANGYKKHKGQWRKKAMKSKKGNELKEPAARENDGQAVKPLTVYLEGEELIYALNKLNTASPDMREFLEVQLQETKMLPGLMEALGNTYVIDEHLIANANMASGTKQVLRQNYFRIRRELQIESTSGMAKMLLENMATAWLRLQIIEHENAIVNRGACTLKELMFWDEKLRKAQARFDSTVATFANAKMKLGPALFIQINYAAEGGRQVNVTNQGNLPPK